MDVHILHPARSKSIWLCLKGTSNDYQFVTPVRIRYGVNSGGSPVMLSASGFLRPQE